MNSQLVSRLSLLVERACDEKSNRYGYGIWTHHVKPMLPIARDLAMRIGADQEIVTIAVLLHDYAGIADGTKKDAHHIHGAAEADRILSEEGYPSDRIERVKACILSHRGSVAVAKDTREQQCVADADAIIHMREVPSLFFVAYHELGMGIDEGACWVKEKLQRDWSKLSDIGKQVARKRYESLQAALQ